MGSCVFGGLGGFGGVVVGRVFWVGVVGIFFFRVGVFVVFFGFMFVGSYFGREFG